MTVSLGIHFLVHQLEGKLWNSDIPVSKLSLSYFCTLIEAVSSYEIIIIF